MTAQKIFKKYYLYKSGILELIDGERYEDVLFIDIKDNDYIFMDDNMNVHSVYCENIKSFNYHQVTGKNCGPWPTEEYYD